MTNVHVKIKNLREESHLKQRQVADYLGISQQAYSYYELDKRELPSRHVVNLGERREVRKLARDICGRQTGWKHFH